MGLVVTGLIQFKNCWTIQHRLIVRILNDNKNRVGVIFEVFVVGFSVKSRERLVCGLKEGCIGKW